MRAPDIAAALADRIEALARDLLPGGHRESNEWRCGSVSGDAGDSLGVHLGRHKAGVWRDFAAGVGGDALDLVREVRGGSTGEALAWARRWLGIDDGVAELPRRAAPAKAPETVGDADRWRYPWGSAHPIAGTLAERYLHARGLRFDDPAGDVLRFAAKRARKAPEGDLQHPPAMLAALRDARTSEQVGIINIYLLPDGSDRIRDQKGKTITGRAKDAVVMLDGFDEPTMGLTVCEGVETGIALHRAGQRPVWACGGAGNLAAFPVLDGIEALTIAADADEPGQRAAETVAARWRSAGREVTIMSPPGARDAWR